MEISYSPNVEETVKRIIGFTSNIVANETKNILMKYDDELFKGTPVVTIVNISGANHDRFSSSNSVVIAKWIDLFDSVPVQALIESIPPWRRAECLDKVRKSVSLYYDELQRNGVYIVEMTTMLDNSIDIYEITVKKGTK